MMKQKQEPDALFPKRYLSFSAKAAAF